MSATRTPRRRRTASIIAVTAVALGSYALLVTRDLREAAEGFAYAVDGVTRPAASPPLSPLPPAPARPTPAETIAARQPEELADTASEIDSAPPAAPVNAVAPPVFQQGTTLAGEHLPAEPARQDIRDAESYARELETLLADDPESLQTVREMLSEPDPVKRNENLRLIRDAFGIQ